MRPRLLPRRLRLEDPLMPWLLLAVAALLPLAVAASAAAETVAPEVQEVRECVERNAPKSVRGEGALERSDAEGGTQRLEASFFWKRDARDLSRFLIRIEAPPDERGSAFLLLQREGGGEDLFSYLPELGKVRRITSRTISGSLFGTDFSFEDVQMVQSAASRTRVERLPDAEVEGRPVYVLAATSPPDAGSEYQRVVMRIDRETCVLLEADLYGRPDVVTKQVKVAFSDIEQHGTHWLPKKVVLADREDGTESRLVIEKAKWDAQIPDSFFSERELAKGH
jgi:hypothetical protein